MGQGWNSVRVNNLILDHNRYQGARGYYNYSKNSSMYTLQGLEIYRKWLFMAEVFSHCQLTYEKDRFPALSGLTHYFQELSSDQFLTGIWRKDLLRGLLWRHQPQNKTPSQIKYQGM